jgi:hypothetical protein
MNTPIPSSADRNKTSQIPEGAAGGALVGPLIRFTITPPRKRLSAISASKKR